MQNHILPVVYVAGPITQNPDYLAHFRWAERQLKQADCQPLLPIILPEWLDWGQALHICYSLIDTADALAFLPGSGKSEGAILEIRYAESLGKPVYPIRHYMDPESRAYIGYNQMVQGMEDVDEEDATIEVFKRRLLVAKLAKHVTWAQMSKETGVSTSTLSNYTNQNALPNSYTLLILADYLGVSTDWLLGREGEWSGPAPQEPGQNDVTSYTNLQKEVMNDAG